MIPLGDSEAVRRLSPVTTILVAANLAIFGFELWDNSFLPVTSFALVPERIWHLQLSQPASAIVALCTLMTSLFLHAGVAHIAGNMLYLLVFGLAVEGRLVLGRFMALYLALDMLTCR